MMDAQQTKGTSSDSPPVIGCNPEPAESESYTGSYKPQFNSSPYNMD
jgi:hypothetical protein